MTPFLGVYMLRVPVLARSFDMRRSPVNKHRSARQFNSQSARTKAANVRPGPMRGGIRL